MKLKIEKLGEVTNASVLKCTGKDWNEWILLLQEFGAQFMTHKEIVTELKKKKYKLSLWWQQVVTSGYEIHIGRKLPGRNAKGLFSLTVTKSVSLSQKEVWKKLCSSEGQKIWLKPWSPLKFVPKTQFEVSDGYFGEVRTVKAASRLRLSWQDPDWDKATSVQIYVIGRKNSGTMLAIQQEGMLSADVKTKMRARWRAAIDAFAQSLTPKAKGE